jgi:hypothetical protein
LEAPNLPSFFKSKRARQFNYKPWFYDPAKEEREKRNRILKAGMDLSADAERSEVQMRLHEKWKESRSALKQRSKSNFRLIVIIGLLLMASYYLLK